LPWYNSLLETNLKLTYVDWKLLCGILGIVFITGVLAGTYPAIYLSSLKPALILKGTNKRKRSVLRETLVVLQFGLAIVLIINTIIIKKQRDFMQKEDVGIQKENIIYLPLRGTLYQKVELFKSEMSHDPSVKSISFSSHLPSGVWSNGGNYKWADKPPQVDPLVSSMSVDFDYVKTFGLKMHDGEFYSEKKYNDTNHIVINKVFADIIGLKPIIGQIIEKDGRKLSIIGVTENFHFKPLHAKIEPLAMYCFSRRMGYIFLKVSSNNMQKTIRKIEEMHNKINGEYPFEYHFLDETYDQLYKGEERQGKIFGFFSFLAIFISCLGLFGLSSFMIAQHTREIGIRKANGAMVTGLMLFFIKYYVKWVLVSFLIAAPVSYYFLNAWLKNFAYKTSLSWWIFAIAGLIAFLIALVTVSWQSWRAANRNPMETLRYE